MTISEVKSLQPLICISCFAYAVHCLNAMQCLNCVSFSWNYIISSKNPFSFYPQCVTRPICPMSLSHPARHSVLVSSSSSFMHRFVHVVFDDQVFRLGKSEALVLLCVKYNFFLMLFLSTSRILRTTLRK